MIRKLHIQILISSITVAFSLRAEAAFFQEQDTAKTDTLKPYESSKTPTFQPAYRFGDPFSNRISRSPLFLRDPSQVDMQVRFNPDTTSEDAGVTYSVYENIGDLDFRPATFMTFQEFNQYNNSQLNKEYFKERSAGLDGESAVSGRSLIPRLFISPIFDRIFGGSYVDIQPNGFVNLDFGARFQRIDNPELTLRQQRNGAFNFDQQISLNVVGKVGEKLEITANFDNNNTFDFQNNLRVVYTGYEEDIIKTIEIGNVSMPVSNSLISGAQSLFGIKTDLQFGKLFVTAIASQQRGRSETVTIESGFQGREFEIRASEYDENRHFFLGHFFRDNYERWLATLPQVTSGVNITRMEVYVLNRNNDTETTRNVVGLMDLGEGSVIFNDRVIPAGSQPANVPTRNPANNLFNNLNVDLTVGQIDEDLRTRLLLESDVDYVKVTTARQLDPTEYTFDSRLGYISLTRRLQSDEMLAVAYEYTFNGQPYRVGELSEEYQTRPDDRAIYLKLLRPNQINVDVPTWDLMMKNVYNLNASQVSQEGFQLRVIYRDDATGQDNPSLHEGQNLKDIPLLRVFGLDRLNPNNDRQPDGNFDFIEGFTIDTRNGNIIFPVLEPFGSTLEAQFESDENRLVEKFVYDDLYSQPKAEAELNAGKNKFFISGRLTAGSTNEIQLPGINIAEGSVIVTAGNTILTEGLDYSVDYNLGSVRILNDGILNSGKTINVAYEKADLFNFQTRTLTGVRFDYRFNDNFNVGATVLHLNERPGGISRFAVGNEPTANTKYGFDINYQSESRFLTKVVDALPFISTKEPSAITFNAEFAQLIPGTSNIVNGEGTSYIDDFENAITPINIGGWQSWKLAATPTVISESRSLENRFRVAKVAWYTVDNSIFYNSGGNNNRPGNIDDDDLENHYERSVLPQEIFRQRDQTLVNFNEPIFDVAYFPNERGQYNYDANFQTGRTPDVEDEVERHWGGITRAITNEVNFNQNNIEYIEFWLLDPFIDPSVAGERARVKDGIVNGFAREDIDGGKLIFNLGSVSEDIGFDDQHAFENGLPIDGQVVTPLNSDWGQITTEQFLTNFFENTAGARDNQDVGLDGLRGTDEGLIVNNDTVGYGPDISADNFRYILDPFYDQQDAKIVERYKNWNGMEDNSNTDPVGDFIPASTNLPDNEDLNRDNTVSSQEQYFEYTIPLVPGNNSIGGNLELNPFIVDQISSGDDQSTWYQFRIPIRTTGSSVGAPSFENIKYIRMYLTGFSRPVVLRMAQMRLVGSQWRKYEQALNEPGLNEIPNTNPTDFDISVVSIEENSTNDAGGIRYVLPPGLDRDIDNTTTQNRRINEQSLQICVEDLDDKDGRAVYKNVNYDLINYGRMKMFIHAEENGDNLMDDRINAFIRLGTDFDENYYEVEFPLQVTREVDQSGDVARQVWPEQNELDISIQELLGIKSERNRLNRDENTPYATPSNDGKYIFRVKGRPDISSVQVLMLGVRNPGDESTSPESVCIWANELRVTDFDTNAGWAANVRMSAKLADLGTISASTRYTSIGFGGIQQRISERTREETIQYDISANINLEKFLRPDKTGLKIPMFVSYEKTRVTPQFDPLDPDVPLEASLETFDTEEERNQYRRIVEDRTTRRSINFTNVRKEKVNPEAPSRVYDIENFSFSYAYSDRETSNVNTQLLFDKTVSGGINYSYSPASITFEPFRNSQKLSSPYFALLKDFNISPLPSSFSFSANLRRDFRLTQYYNNDLTTEGVEPLYERLFTFIRNYSFRWDFTKSLGLTYNATANAVIDEPEGEIEGDITTAAERRYIFNQILNLGRMKNFNQTIGLNYSLPLNKLPFTDWLSADARYSVGYNWVAGAIERGDGERFIDNTENPGDPNDQIDLFFGNFISNQRTIGINTRVDMNTLYNKVTFLKNANRPPNKDESLSPGNQFLRFLMMIQSVNGSYTINESTSLPGFKPQAFLFGLDSGFNAPGIDFILGSQNPKIRQKAARNGWLIENENLNSPFQQTYGTDLDIQADLQPATDLRVQLTWNRGINNQYQEIFRFDGEGGFETLTPTRSGSYATSFLSIRTAFERNRDDNFSKAFEDFRSNLEVMRTRLNEENTNRNGIEYDSLSQDVLIPAFRAAYSGQNANSADLDPFPVIPLPNWRLDYTGLINIPALAEIFSSFTVSHGYSSTYTASAFTSNNIILGEANPSELIDLQNNILNYPLALPDTTGNLAPVYFIGQVIISEQFAPLIGFNVRTQNNISTRVEFRKSRNLSLNTSNAQVAETKNNDITIDFGYSKVGWKLPFRWQGRTVTLKNDITFRIAASIRDSKTVQRRVSGESDITNGNFSYQFQPTVTYKINNQLDFTFYLERNVTNPRFGNTFKRATTAGGFQLRFSLSQ
ncbi:MAG: cell surface protein SprA [Bacteroidota bacterium]